ncbi:MAG: GNAT family N-acetyltransferase [Proteobacteria bacterium]|nr:GNAT family N-acetyltransferase [Pseudomonadota bacterium]
MTINIRNAGSEDKAACVGLLKALSGATGSNITLTINDVFERLLDKNRGEILVAEEAGVLLGMATVSYNLALRYGGEYCQLEELIVSERARGKNLGGLLVQRTVDTARARGCAEYGLYLVESTEHNRGFYEKYGFIAVGTEMRQKLRDSATGEPT